MNPEKWRKIKEIFNQAVEIETAERASYLDSVCPDDAEIRGELEKLLAEDTKDETLFDPFIEPISFAEAIVPSGNMVGKYQIIKEIGEGGMGAVYLAQRSDLGSKAALKIVKKGMDTADLLRRFETEQKILANLAHPNIARLLDNGTTETGLPYYVMEYVEGETLLKYVNAGQVAVRERLEIFRKICSAVQFAHSHLVVHRDLKPSNILITKDNEPKLLDFGIAKVLNPEQSEIKGTATLLGMMTPNYASPEQLRGETVTTASDIYSLGVILYELMTGTLPFNLKQYTLIEMMQVVSTTEPQTPSQVVNRVDANQHFISQLKGDLDNIILKSLKKEHDRRYLSAEQLSEDIGRHLNGLPVRARPDTFGYRASKFVRRNKLGVVGAALIFLSLVGGIIGTTYQAQVAGREREKAEKRFDDLRQISNRLIFKYNEAISNLPGATSTRAMFVQEATQFLDSLADEQSSDEKLQLELAQAYLKVGDLQKEISSFDSEETLRTYQKSLDLSEKLYQVSQSQFETKSVYASALQNVGALQSAKNLNDTAQTNLQKAVSIREMIQQDDPDNSENRFALVESYLALGNFYVLNKAESAAEFFQKALNLSEKLVNDPTAASREWRLFAQTNQILATIETPPKAVILQNQAIEYLIRVLDNKPNSIKAKEEFGKALLQRANIYKLLNKSDLSAKDTRQSSQIFENLLQSDSKNEALKKLLSEARGENISKSKLPATRENETIKDDIFK